MGTSGVQYSESYGENCFGTSSTYAPMIDDSSAVALSVAHTALRSLAEQQNDRTANESTCK